MEDVLINILIQNSVKKRVVKNIVLISIAFLKAQGIFMRQIASFLPLNTLKQSKVNKVWRFFHKMKISTISCFEAFSKIIINKIKTDFVIIDFTPLRFPEVEIFIASFPFKGRSLPFYTRILKKEDLDL